VKVNQALSKGELNAEKIKALLKQTETILE
jgi:hypothetical protein